MSSLFPDDKSMITHALKSWANTIETNNAQLSAQDFKNCYPSEIPKLLSQEQVDLVARIRVLAEKESKK